MTLPLIWLDALIFGIKRVLSSGTEVSSRPTINFEAPLIAADDTLNRRTNVTLDTIEGVDVDPDFGAQNILTTGYLGLGATLPGTGDLRVKTGFKAVGIDNAGTNDVDLLEWTTGDILAIGSDNPYLGGITVDVPDATEFVVKVDSTAALTVGETISTPLCLVIGDNAASTGDIRLPNNAFQYWANATGYNVRVVGVDTSNDLLVGKNSAYQRHLRLDVGGGNSIYVGVSGADVLTISGSSITAAQDVVMAASKSVDCYTNSGYMKPRRVRQATIPTPVTGELLVWSDSDDDSVYLVYNDPDAGNVSVALT